MSSTNESLVVPRFIPLTPQSGTLNVFVQLDDAQLEEFGELDEAFAIMAVMQQLYLVSVVNFGQQRTQELLARTLEVYNADSRDADDGSDLDNNSSAGA